MPYPLSATALIEQDDDGEVIVWLCHDNPQDHPHNHSFVAGHFDTFEAAVEALAGVRGLTIEKVYRGPKFGDEASLVVLDKAGA
jgi:hypothetical protein